MQIIVVNCYNKREDLKLRVKRFVKGCDFLPLLHANKLKEEGGRRKEEDEKQSQTKTL